MVDDDDDLRFGDVSGNKDVSTAGSDLSEQVIDIFRAIAIILIGSYVILTIVQALFGIQVPFI